MPFWWLIPTTATITGATNPLGWRFFEHFCNCLSVASSMAVKYKFLSSMRTLFAFGHLRHSFWTDVPKILLQSAEQNILIFCNGDNGFKILVRVIVHGLSPRIILQPGIFKHSWFATRYSPPLSRPI